MEKKKDIVGVIPQVGDIIVFNPPNRKGLTKGTCVGFTKAGLPVVKPEKEINGAHTNAGNYAPKTGFAVLRPLIQ